MSKIKTLEEHELPRMFPLMQAFVTEVGHLGFSSDSFAGAWSGMLALNIAEILYIEDENKVIIAAFGGAFIPDSVSGILCAAENFWFVREDKRELRLGWHLFNRFEESARARGCKRILMVHLANSKEDLLPKFYAKHGYELAEQTFMKEL